MRQQYDSYKSTGIHWIPIIPSHWQISSVGKHYQVILGKMLCPKPIDAFYTLEEYYCAGDVHFDGVNSLNLKQMWFSPEEKDKYLVKDKDLLIVEGGAGAGGCALARVSDDAERYIQNSILIARHPRNSTALLKYIIENFVRAGYIDGVCNEATFAHFTKEKVSHVPYPLMPYAEQEAIAAWLEEKCEDIDAAIAKVDREIELIDELKQSEISRVVTRGLNPDTPLRPSGIDWIGDIPEHWTKCRLKFIGSARNGLTYSPSDVKDSGKLVIRSSNIQDSKLNYDDCVFVANYPETLSVNSGDTIICSRNGSINLIGKSVFIEDDMDVTFGAFMMRFRPYEHPKYSHYLLSIAISRYKGLFATTTINQLTADSLGKMEAVMPPYMEQVQIADYLDKKCAAIDGLKAKLIKKRETLTELRQSIISEVVTGKRKVI